MAQPPTNLQLLALLLSPTFLCLHPPYRQLGQCLLDRMLAQNSTRRLRLSIKIRLVGLYAQVHVGRQVNTRLITTLGLTLRVVSIVPVSVINRPRVFRVSPRVPLLKRLLFTHGYTLTVPTLPNAS